MKWIGRSPLYPPDPALPALDTQQATRLGDLALAELRQRGVDANFSAPGVISTTDGRIYGMHNLSIAVADAPERAWPGIVARHWDGLLTATNEDPAEADPANWYLKLRPVADLPEPTDYGVEVLPGILALAAIDTPTAVRESHQRADKPYLADLAGYEQRARGNLATLPAPEHTHLQPDPNEPTSAIEMFVSDDFFGASRLLVLDRLLSSVGIERPEHGCLVIVPNRHLLGVHVLNGVGFIAAVSVLANVASDNCESAPGPISAEIFYRAPDGSAEQITRRRPDGELVVEATGQFGTALSRLGLTGGT